MTRTFFPGTRVMVFDPSLYKDDVATPLSVTVKPATVLRWYGYRSKQFGIYESMIDVLFDHRPKRESKGHLTFTVRTILNEVQGDS